MERLLSMIVRRLVNKGVNLGVKSISQRGGNRQEAGQQDSTAGRQMHRQGQKNAQGLRQASRMLRRITRL